MFYYKKELIKQGKLFCVYQSNARLTEEEIDNINKIQDNLLQDTIVYESNYPFVGYPILEGETLRPATIVELIDMGEQTLLEGEILDRDNNKIITVEKPSWQYKWDFDNKKWVPDTTTFTDGQYVDKDKIVDVEYNVELGYIKPMWNKTSHEWYDGATDLDRVQAQIDEYSAMDTPSILKEMGTELADECMNMLIQLRNMAYEIQNTTEVDGVSFRHMSLFVRQSIILPQPSQALKDFKNKINKIIK